MPTKKLNKLMTLLKMDFPERLSTLRREKRMTQQQLADATEIHVSQIKRYEAGFLAADHRRAQEARPSTERKRGPATFRQGRARADGDLRLQFEAVERLSEDDQRTIASLIDAYLKKSQIESIMQAR